MQEILSQKVSWIVQGQCCVFYNFCVHVFISHWLQPSSLCKKTEAYWIYGTCPRPWMSCDSHSVLCSCRSYPSVPSFTHCLQSLQFACSYELAKAIHVSSGKVKAVCKMFSALPETFASLWEMIENHRGIDWCTDLCNLLLLEFIEMSLCSLQKWGHSQAPGYLPTPLPPVIFSGPGQNQTWGPFSACSVIRLGLSVLFSLVS